jgi:putative peptidoglycan lipid II flippase
VELPLGVFGIAVGTATLPSFSEQVSKGNFEEFKKTIAFSLRLILFITIPAMIALIALREPIISVLFQRGHFDVQSTIFTAQALLYYAVGLWAFSVIRVIVSAFYSLQDTKNPMKAAIVALLVNVACSVILMFPLKHGGLALATSIASAVNVIMLTLILKRKIGPFVNQDFYRSVSKMIIASAAMWGAIVLIDVISPWKINGSFHERLAFLTIAIAVGAVTFFGICAMIRIPEMMTIMRILQKKFRRA